jgi:signal transduction histidine kinase
VVSKSKTPQVRPTARGKRRPASAVRTATAAAKRARADATVAYLSHEARNTLSAILGFCELIEAEALGPVGNVKYSEYVRHIRSSATHLSRLMNDSLDGSGALGERRLNETIVRLHETVSAAVAMASGLANVAGVDLAFAADDNGVCLYADPTKLRQIVLNLLTNAIKYTRVGGRVGVAIRAAGGGEVAIVVSDTGIGMSRSEVGRTFAPYVRHSGARALDRPGTGLGLFLTRRLVAAHDGRIDVASERGRGTSVKVIFPADRIVPSNVLGDRRPRAA